MFNTFNLFLEGDNSFCSPFNFVSEERNGFFILKERKEREKFSKRRRNRRVFNIFRKRISGDKRKEASCEFFSNNFLVSWVNKPLDFLSLLIYLVLSSMRVLLKRVRERRESCCGER